ncbi:MAG: glycosyltransferase [Acidimicrobiales bacterium]
MRRLAVLSFHTSPLGQPGTGDAGGMNVYVLQLSTALARAGVACDVYTRAADASAPAIVDVEPGLRVHHIPAGPLAPVPKESLSALVEEFTDGVLARIQCCSSHQDTARPDAIHANYWLSGLAGHVIKHELGLPLVSTFHTLDRVKAEASAEEVVTAEPARRAEAEAAIIACSDAVLASCSVEADQIASLYAADRARIEIVELGVDHALFSPGDRAQARRAVGLPDEGPVLAFVGRIQPLKGADVAIRALGILHDQGFGTSTLVVIGGPSGPLGARELGRLHDTVSDLGLGAWVRFIEPQPHELLSSWYRAADLCLVPSRSESFGLVALEAAACGTPVVAAAVGGLSTLVDDGATGFLVDERDPAAYASRAASLLSDPELARAFAKAAAARSRSYTWSVAAERLLGIYERLTARELVECV